MASDIQEGLRKFTWATISIYVAIVLLFGLIYWQIQQTDDAIDRANAAIEEADEATEQAARDTEDLIAELKRQARRGHRRTVRVNRREAARTQRQLDVLLEANRNIAAMIGLDVSDFPSTVGDGTGDEILPGPRITPTPTPTPIPTPKPSPSSTCIPAGQSNQCLPKVAT